MEKPPQDALIGRIADEFTERLQRGERPEVEQYARLYPQVADLLRGILPALEALRSDTTGPELEAISPIPPPVLNSCLGRFRNHREIGRVGMGIVYDAEQLSLGRRVALTVLP